LQPQDATTEAVGTENVNSSSAVTSSESSITDNTTGMDISEVSQEGLAKTTSDIPAADPLTGDITEATGSSDSTQTKSNSLPSRKMLMVLNKDGTKTLMTIVSNGKEGTKSGNPTSANASQDSPGKIYCCPALDY
jgi:hypothetical protein